MNKAKQPDSWQQQLTSTLHCEDLESTDALDEHSVRLALQGLGEAIRPVKRAGSSDESEMWKEASRAWKPQGQVDKAEDALSCNEAAPPHGGVGLGGLDPPQATLARSRQWELPSLGSDREQEGEEDSVGTGRCSTQPPHPPPPRALPHPPRAPRWQKLLGAWPQAQRTPAPSTLCSVSWNSACAVARHDHEHQKPFGQDPYGPTTRDASTCHEDGLGPSCLNAHLEDPWCKGVPRAGQHERRDAKDALSCNDAAPPQVGVGLGGLDPPQAPSARSRQDELQDPGDGNVTATFTILVGS